MLSRRTRRSNWAIVTSRIADMAWIAPAIVFIFALPSPVFGGENASDSGDTPAQQDARGRRTEAMRARAERAVVRRLVDGKRKLESLNPQPLFRYTDEDRRILDATVWVWPVRGRPVVLKKIEYYDVRAGRPKWFFCVASLSEDLVELTSSGGVDWTSTKPGIKMNPLPDAPKASGSSVGRSVQMKNIVRRFSSKLTDPPINTEQQMRLLARPLHRYSDPDAGIVDGTIFGFATNGTNPDLLLLVELAGDDSSGGSWRYGLARMTVGQLNVRLDETEVWSVPYVSSPGPGRPARFDTWAFSWEPKE